MKPVVCHISSVHQPYDTRIFHKECKTLAAAGYQVHLVVPAPFAREEREGVKVIGVARPARRWQRPMTWWRIYRTIRRLRPALVHFHDVELIPLGLWLRLVHRMCVIYDVHEYVSLDILDKPWIPRLFRRPVAWLVGGLESIAARAFSAVVVVNDHMADLFRPWSRRVVTLANYPVLHAQQASDGQAVETMELLYVGGINQERGLGLLADALQRLQVLVPGVRCTLVGPVDTASVDTSLLDELEAQGFLRRVGTVPYAEVSRYLGPHAIGVIPWLPLANNVLGTPTKLFEYMAAGAPVVAPNYGFIAEIVSKVGCGRLYRPGDPDALVGAMAELLADVRTAQRLGRLGASAVHRQYSWQSQARNLVALYDELLQVGSKE